MPPRAPRPPRAPLGDPLDPHGLGIHAEGYIEALRSRHYAEATLAHRRRDLGSFIGWCAPRGIARPHEVTRPILDRYQAHLAQRRKRDGQPLSVTSQFNRLVSVKMFFRWLARGRHILTNPASELELPRVPKRLPRYVLTRQEAEAVLALPRLDEPLGLRDRAILEVFYSTGIRRMELIGLELPDVDYERGTLFVRQGKGRKDRMVPVGERALSWVQKYVEEVRPHLVRPPDPGRLFLSREGEALSAIRLSQMVHRYVEAAETGKGGACHLFRHTMATLMLEGGADVRFIQQMLGHAELSTTEIYTQVSIRLLKAVHTATHPAAALTRNAEATGALDAIAAGRVELFARLAEEDEEGEEPPHEPPEAPPL